MGQFEHAGEEPGLRELLADDIVHLVMRCDGISESDVLAAIERARTAEQRKERASESEPVLSVQLLREVGRTLGYYEDAV